MDRKLLEKSKIRIVSPSYKRAGNIDALKVFGSDLILAVHEFEADQYRKEHDNEILVLPDSLQKNMAKVRNYILDHTDTERIIMVDDDVQSVLNIENKKQTEITELYAFIVNAFQLADELGTGLWGLNLIDDPEAYRVYTPFSLRSPILGPFTGITKSELRYDERLSLNEDYDFFIQSVFKFKKTLRFNKYSYRASHLTKKGGCGSYRLLTEEMKQAKIMQQKWGKKIASYDFKKSTNPRVRL